jgi:hypothetical protein
MDFPIMNTICWISKMQGWSWALTTNICSSFFTPSVTWHILYTLIPFVIEGFHIYGIVENSLYNNSLELLTTMSIPVKQNIHSKNSHNLESVTCKVPDHSPFIMIWQWVAAIYSQLTSSALGSGSWWWVLISR